MHALTLHYHPHPHPLSSCCHKVLIALDVLGIEADKRLLNLGDPDGRAARAVAKARDDLASAYAFIERQLAGRTWVAGDAFSMADCAAAPALFYAVAYLPLPPRHGQLAAYVERLMAHPSVALTIEQARPYFKFFPGRRGLSRSYFDPAAA
ncbi:glutathione S-transferase [Massilia genomosp. 1]|uniref:GST C-terminal domain-containing protein n=1 Tax=Massilia genomosp. 1 TaxID=2609280 RepID=A0ABX0MN36_9BURK|nr:glutathione S-transferase family protein [Massilia genomosp. 1]NHZ64178.1 hypothetical protein [Massilia genomosp. 1]